MTAATRVTDSCHHKLYVLRVLLLTVTRDHWTVLIQTSLDFPLRRTTTTLRYLPSHPKPFPANQGSHLDDIKSKAIYR